MARVVVLDTETTGFSPAEGHRIVEVGCVELLGMRKGEQRQWYINPEREIPQDAIRVHGITNEKVADAPKFHEIVKEFLAFIGGDPLVIHNAAFDMGFLNAELARLKMVPLAMSRAIDTIPMARRKFPGAQANLDALCKRLGVDNSRRSFHGALLDAHLLAEVYVALNDGGQYKLDLVTETPAAVASSSQVVERKVVAARAWNLSPQEEESHRAYLEFLQKESGGNCLWLKEEGASA
ncbi:MAG: DNA polymerase III subunit epsilon [Magnetococcales bacterium]|nr:DNA polymerase III subunit epsilon [Magnetococcales bacterium]NGZ28104.1 DNA polymerase III subunit epsilon [Magnetococcales bacterium]